jgi:hypothetical protein
MAREFEIVCCSMQFHKWTIALGHKMVVKVYLDPQSKLIAQRFRCHRATHSRQLSKYLDQEQVCDKAQGELSFLVVIPAFRGGREPSSLLGSVNQALSAEPLAQTLISLSQLKQRQFHETGCD